MKEKFIDQDALREDVSPKADEEQISADEKTAAAENTARDDAPMKEEHSAREEHAAKEERPEVEGILEIQEENNFGFLRFSNFLTSEKDIYVSPTQIRRFNLKTGDKIRGITGCQKRAKGSARCSTSSPSTETSRDAPSGDQISTTLRRYFHMKD